MSLSQLPTELLLWIGSYLTITSRASLCLQSKLFRSVFARPTSGASLCLHSKRFRCALARDLFYDMIAPLVLLWAAEVNDTETMKLALRYRADVNYMSLEERTPLSFVAERGDIVMTRLLLGAEGVDIYRRDTVLGSPLSWASKMGHATVVDLLVAADAEKNADYICHALKRAASGGHIGIVERLLTSAKKDPGFRSRGGHGERLLGLAAQDGNEKIVELYLAAGINHDACGLYGRSALSQASSYHGGIMKILIAAGADINMKDSDGGTPLMLAVTSGYKTGVEILLNERGIDINVRDMDGDTALSLAELYEHQDIVKLLRAAEQAEIDASSGSTVS